jgi:hypothetical protein
MAISILDVHVRQSTPGSCVAACVCMVRRRRGERIEEHALLGEWGSPGPFALTVHAEDMRDPSFPSQVDPTLESSWGLLRAILRLGRWVIVSIVPLPHPGRSHAVVLIGSGEDDLYLYLDPAAPSDAQPRAFSEDDLVQQWTGQMIVCAAFD